MSKIKSDQQRVYHGASPAANVEISVEFYFVKFCRGGDIFTKSNELFLKSISIEMSPPHKHRGTQQQRLYSFVETISNRQFLNFVAVLLYAPV